MNISKIDGLYEFRCGRLAIYQRLFPKFLYPGELRFALDEAPGFWYFQLGHWRVSWRRRWIVWGPRDPWRGDNIRHYDQFGTWESRT